MSERYTRLFSLSENLGQEGAPVVISAGALLSDNNTGKVIAQLKLRNISERPIKSVKVKVNAYDTAGNELKGVEAFSYIDLAAERNSVFGSQTPIILPDKTTRSFSVEILSVVFVDGEVYQPDSRETALPVKGEMLKAVQQLEDEQNSIAEREKKRRVFFWLSFLPLMMDVLAILLYVVSSLGDGVLNLKANVYWEWRAWLVSFLVPCMCILVCYFCEGKRKWISIAFGISVAFLIFQIIAVSCWRNYMDGNDLLHQSNLTRVISRWICGRNVSSFGGLFSLLRQLFLEIKHNVPMQIIRQTICSIVYRMSQLLFVGKNLCACVVLFLQVRRKNPPMGKI